MTKSLDFILINLLTILIIIAATLVICSKTLIYSIFSLVAVFAIGIWFFAYSDAEYVMLLFLIIYLGAVLVFFSFALMLLDKKYWIIYSKNTDSHTVLILTKFFFIIFSFILIYTLSLSISKFNFENAYYNQVVLTTKNLQLTNVEEIGLLLYSDFILLLLIGGLVLLIAIIGCVILIKPYTRKMKKN
jgi:NADH-quinone oxidoreductase subunit J